MYLRSSRFQLDGLGALGRGRYRRSHETDNLKQEADEADMNKKLSLLIALLLLLAPLTHLIGVGEFNGCKKDDNICDCQKDENDVSTCTETSDCEKKPGNTSCFTSILGGDCFCGRAQTF